LGIDGKIISRYGSFKFPTPQKLPNFGSVGQRWEFQKILEIKLPYIEIIRNFNPCPKGSA
jgi:hypothetical protein